MDGRPNRRNKAAFSKFSVVVREGFITLKLDIVLTGTLQCCMLIYSLVVATTVCNCRPKFVRASCQDPFLF